MWLVSIFFPLTSESTFAKSASEMTSLHAWMSFPKVDVRQRSASVCELSGQDVSFFSS